MSDEVEDAVATEIKKQMVTLVFTVLGILAVMAIQADPASRRRAVMRAMDWTERAAGGAAKAGTDLALKARGIYNRYRSNPD